MLGGKIKYFQTMEMVKLSFLLSKFKFLFNDTSTFVGTEKVRKETEELADEKKEQEGHDGPVTLT